MGGQVACVDCHFLVKTAFVPPSSRPVFVVSEAERAAGRRDDFAWVHEYEALSCSRGVWDEGRGSLPEQRHEQLIRHRPKASCFFLQFAPGMSLAAALELGSREAAGVEARHNRRPVWIGSAIAAVTAVLAYIAVAAARGWWPF